MDEAKRIIAGLVGWAAAGYDRVGFFHQVAYGLLARGDRGCGSRRSGGTWSVPLRRRGGPSSGLMVKRT